MKNKPKVNGKIKLALNPPREQELRDRLIKDGLPATVDWFLRRLRADQVEELDDLTLIEQEFWKRIKRAYENSIN
jgi:hypothetical protein